MRARFAVEMFQLVVFVAALALPVVAQDGDALDAKSVKGAEKHYSPYVNRNLPDRVQIGRAHV